MIRLNIETIKRNTTEAVERLYISGVEQYYDGIRDEIIDKSQNGFNYLQVDFKDTGYPPTLEIRIINQLVEILRADGFNIQNPRVDDETRTFYYIIIHWS
uniref:Phage protein n=1 Tax=viral metagenome TaxID=1070528 RepID=A0A6C0JVF7_9ZZZZ